MDELRIRGGHPLQGEITTSGSKNAALPMMAAALLTSEPVHLSNVPMVKDVLSMIELFQVLGAQVQTNAEGLTITAAALNCLQAPYEIVRTMRASFLILGPVLARFGKVAVSLPGGCAIGTRPVDQHLKVLSAMGAEIRLADGYVTATTPGRLQGATVDFDLVTVGGTQNTLMAAALAQGTSVLRNAAREPEVMQLASLLRAMGAKIEGDGTSTIQVQGVASLKGCSLPVMPDRIEAGTYLVAALATQGHIRLTNTCPEALTSVLTTLQQFGANITSTVDTVELQAAAGITQPVDFQTSAYPGIPTDLQAQLMVLNCLAPGSSHISETVFENRFMHVQELVRMGADVKLPSPTVAKVHGVSELRGARVMATDLRASFCLVIAALAARGHSTISRIYHIDRGYEAFEEKLSSLGADVERVSV